MRNLFNKIKKVARIIFAIADFKKKEPVAPPKKRKRRPKKKPQD